MFFIYKITNQVNNKCYIGSSNSDRGMETRWNEHISSSQKKSCCGYNYPLQKAMRKYGIENFVYEIIEDNIQTREKRAEREKYWIIKCNSLTNVGHGYNQTLYTDCALSDPEIQAKQIAKTSKPCALVDNKENILQLFASVNEAARFAHQSDGANNITRICNGETRSINGLIFRWINADGTIIIPKFKTRKRRTKIMGVSVDDPNDIVYAESISDAARIYDIPRTSLSKCVNGSTRYSIVHNRKWYKIEE